MDIYGDDFDDEAFLNEILVSKFCWILSRVEIADRLSGPQSGRQADPSVLGTGDMHVARRVMVLLDGVQATGYEAGDVIGKLLANVIIRHLFDRCLPCFTQPPDSFLPFPYILLIN